MQDDSGAWLCKPYTSGVNAMGTLAWPQNTAMMVCLLKPRREGVGWPFLLNLLCMPKYPSDSLGPHSAVAWATIYYRIVHYIR